MNPTYSLPLHLPVAPLCCRSPKELALRTAPPTHPSARCSGVARPHVTQQHTPGAAGHCTCTAARQAARAQRGRARMRAGPRLVLLHQVRPQRRVDAPQQLAQPRQRRPDAHRAVVLPPARARAQAGRRAKACTQRQGAPCCAASVSSRCFSFCFRTSHRLRNRCRVAVYSTWHLRLGPQHRAQAGKSGQPATTR